MSIDIDKVDISILYYLYTSKKISSLYSVQIITIQKYFEDEKPVSYYTILRRVEKLVTKEYLIHGYKYRNAKTYYLSQQGIDFVEKNLLESEKLIYENNESEE